MEEMSRKRKKLFGNEPALENEAGFGRERSRRRRVIYDVVGLVSLSVVFSPGKDVFGFAVT